MIYYIIRDAMNDQNTIFKNYFLFANSVKDEYNVEDVKKFDFKFIKQKFFNLIIKKVIISNS